jgi:hypothetical protein
MEDLSLPHREPSVSEATSNAALERLNALVGEWNIEIVHPLIPATTVHGKASFAWLEQESFLEERSEVEHDAFPDSVAIIGCDDGTGQYTQCYSDSRGVHRIYQMGLDGTAWRLWRDDPGFSQRFTGTFSEDGRTITGAWEVCKDGSTWEHDFDKTYTKVG